MPLLLRDVRRPRLDCRGVSLALATLLVVGVFGVLAGGPIKIFLLRDDSVEQLSKVAKLLLLVGPDDLLQVDTYD